MQKIRVRALWIVVGIGLTTLGVISMTALPALPVVGVAVAAVALVLNTMMRDLTTNTCLGCGIDLSDQPAGVHGRICPSCGAVNERLALSERDDDRKT